MKPIVSVVIPTYNEERNIENCLRSVQAQTYPKECIEIIITDSERSVDRTRELAQKYTPLVFIKGRERSAQRNFCFERARGEYVIYIDADMTLHPDLLTECVEKLCANEKLVGLYVPEIVQGERFFSKVRRFERGFYDGTCLDAVRILKREVFVKTGGFDERLYAAEDWDLDKKVRQFGEIGMATLPVYHNEGEFELKKYLRKKSYYIGNLDIYINKWGNEDADIKKQFGLRYRFFGVFLENGKWKRLIRHPILTAGMYFLRFMVGIRFLLKKSG